MRDLLFLGHSGGNVSDRKGSDPRILSLRVSELTVSETVYRDTAATGAVQTIQSKIIAQLVPPTCTKVVEMGPPDGRPRERIYGSGRPIQSEI